jgi:hypothetical protein
MDVINLLWTGGWDSTYRLLELLLIEDQMVRPHYIVDPERESIANEIIAMTRIRNRIQVSFPTRAARILPLEMVHLEAIQPDEEITGWFQQLAGKFHIGIQFDWLARFAKYNVREPELCIENGRPVFPPDIFDCIQPLLSGKGHACRVEGPFPEPGLQMFTYFRFPVIHLTKDEMRIISEERGFSDIMQLTWFCHKPQKGLPCGKCQACLMTSAGGLEFPCYQPTFWDWINDVQKRFFVLLMK